MSGRNRLPLIAAYIKESLILQKEFIKISSSDQKKRQEIIIFN